MNIYTFQLNFAKKRTNLTFSKCIKLINEAVININAGLAFKRDEKKLEVVDYNENTLILRLQSRDTLTNPARSLSALTRYLTTYNIEVFESSIYNKTLFSICLLSHEEETTDQNKEITDEELLKVLIDLLYSYTAKDNAETLARNKVIKEMKKLIMPFIYK